MFVDRALSYKQLYRYILHLLVLSLLEICSWEETKIMLQWKNSKRNLRISRISREWKSVTCKMNKPQTYSFFHLQVHVPDQSNLWHIIIQIIMITGIYITVKPLVRTITCMWPPLLSNQFSKIPKLSKSNHYIWNLLLTATSCKWSLPVLKIWNSTDNRVESG